MKKVLSCVRAAKFIIGSGLLAEDLPPILQTFTNLQLLEIRCKRITVTDETAIEAVPDLVDLATRRGYPNVFSLVEAVLFNPLGLEDAISKLQLPNSVELRTQVTVDTYNNDRTVLVVSDPSLQITAPANKKQKYNVQIEERTFTKTISNLPKPQQGCTSQ